MQVGGQSPHIGPLHIWPLAGHELLSAGGDGGQGGGGQ
jgi:hypothetical protein